MNLKVDCSHLTLHTCPFPKHSLYFKLKIITVWCMDCWELKWGSYQYQTNCVDVSRYHYDCHKANDESVASSRGTSSHLTLIISVNVIFPSLHLADTSSPPHPSPIPHTPSGATLLKQQMFTQHIHLLWQRRRGFR